MAWPKINDKKFGCNIFGRFTIGVVTYTELFFYKLGVKVGLHPFRTIAICWIVVFLSGFGFLRFQQEKNPLKLWVPPHTTFIRDSEWLMNTLQNGHRDENVMITAEDVLIPEIIQQLYEIDYQIREVRSSRNLTIRDVCFEIPKVDKFLIKMFEGSSSKSNKSMKMDQDLFCSFAENMKSECYTKSILELWGFKRNKIYSLTKDDIIREVNDPNNYIFGKLKNYASLLGGIVRNETGQIIKATAIHNIYYVAINFTAIDMDKSGNLAGTADWASEEVLDWENAFLGVMANVVKNYNNTYYYSSRSFGDISNDSMFQDIDLLFISGVIMTIYVQFVISKFNFLEARIVLGFVGLLDIGMAFVVGSGLCSLVGIRYGPVHTSLPFLLMGLGIDDMFVILACWDDLTEEQQKLPLHEKVGLMLKHAGVSITITSFTDVIAFLIGASTILPSLESFCIYAAVCVLMTFIFAITFFIACFVLDQRRIAHNRNGIIPCIKHKDDYVPNECSQRSISNTTFNVLYSKVILTTPGKIITICVSIVCLGFGVNYSLQLKQHFDPLWLVPPNTHLSDYIVINDIHFHHLGFDTGFYMGALNYSHEIYNIQRAVEKLESLDNITSEVVSWVKPFQDFVLLNYHHDIYKMPLDEYRFRTYLSEFLYTPRYAKYRAYVIFDGNLQCGMPAPKIKLSIIDFFIQRYRNPRDQIPAMHAVRNIAETANFTTGDKFSTVWSKYFAPWTTDELIDIEVMRNLQLALLCVMLCTIVLIADWQTCFWIFVCVLITMVDVCGFMQCWGLTIDLVSCIGLELAIGLCVDYATHVGHTFLTIPNGSRQERAIKSVTSIGSAVLYGGLSTLIGVSMMARSNVYTFQTFFKIFFLVILFGLFHGIVLLPVILSLVGPKPYRTHKPIPQNEVEIVDEFRVYEKAITKK